MKIRVDDFHSNIIEEHRKARKDRKGQRKEGDGVMECVEVLLSLPGEDGKEHMDDVEIKALIQVLAYFYFFFLFLLFIYIM